MGMRMMTLGRNHTRASLHPFHLIRYLSPFWTASNLCIFFMQADQIPQYWRAPWLSYGIACAPLSLVHLTATSSNPTVVSNSLLTANNTCANSPHSSTLLATVSWIAFITVFCTRIIGMHLMPASQPCHHFEPLIPSMVAFAKSATQTLKSSNLINLLPCGTYPSFHQWVH